MKKHFAKILKYFFKKQIGFFIHPILRLERWQRLGGKFSSYMISNKGRVISLDRHKSRGKNFLKTRINRDGYEYIVISIDKKKQRFLIHRLVASAFIPNPQNLDTVNHKNFNKTENHIWNLEWMSNVDNVRHAIAGGRISRPTIKREPKIARICTKCNSMKPMEEFNKGYSWCKSCERTRAQRYYSENRDRILASKSKVRFLNIKYSNQSGNA